MNKNFTRLLMMIGVIFSTTAISQAQQVFVANLSGAQEVPSVTTSGKGVCQVVLNAAQTQITVNCRYSGLSSAANAAHIHGSAAVGATAPVLFNFGAVSGVSGTISPAPINVTPQQVADLRANRMYVNVHTANNANGEIRGQLHVANAIFDDYDGDGKSDLGAIRNENGGLVWYVLQSSNGQQRNYYWGKTGDR